ncbi:MAG TPA: hypothetical protein PK926_05240 [Spirochaetota bacterium]|nr:hypothetical protein [Spirochaetota bacterium]HPI88132.1 hypothetical protein [Spirochaetota bacterium]HPR47907.1 hypothetical protein [Spirochaetota bacterium]
MEISDIIKSDQDRLFIVDPECYILYTGDTPEDQKPFIRIGNWINMPVELIPLVENIIISDSLVGNPSLEQFNIDIELLHENRYIGSKNIISRYLDFQKIFGLDLTNTTIVDIEKDIPEITREQISKKNQFTGVFYRNGNFKILHGDDVILDLHALAGQTVNYQAIFDKIHEQSAGTGRFDESGIIIIDHNPFFFHRNRLASYLFPTYVFTDFSRLGIDPGSIQDLIYPSTNFINLTKFLKWIHNTQNVIKIFHDHEEILEPIKKLFSNAGIIREPFSGMSINRSGLDITNYPGTYNMILRYDSIQPDQDKLTIAFVKTPGGIDKIIREQVHCIIINYSAYEDVNLLLQSSDIPVIIVPDGNSNISRLSQSDKIVLKEGLQYEFHLTSDPACIWELSGLNKSAVEEVLKALPQDPFSVISSIGATEDETVQTINKLNLQSVLTLELNTTTDRGYARDLKNIITEIKSSRNRPPLSPDASRIKSHIVFCDNHAYELHEIIPDREGMYFFEDTYLPHEGSEGYYDQKQMEFSRRIEEDRVRLQMLLDIYYQKIKETPEKERDLTSLKHLIEKRKEEYHSDAISSFIPPRETIHETEEAPVTEAHSIAQPEDEPSPRATFKTALKTRTTRKKRFPVYIISGVAVITVALLLMFYKFSSFEKQPDVVIKPVEPITEQQAEIEDESIHIADRDIYVYANKVALKNGYNALSYSKFKEKNPDWIYPSNVFTMLDGERVTVKWGDTLWALARKKLVIMEKKFNSLVDIIEKADDASVKRRNLNEIKKYAYKDSHFSKIKNLEKTIQKK